MTYGKWKLQFRPFQVGFMGAQVRADEPLGEGLDGLQHLPAQTSPAFSENLHFRIFA